MFKLQPLIKSTVLLKPLIIFKENKDIKYSIPHAQAQKISPLVIDPLSLTSGQTSPWDRDVDHDFAS